MVGSRLEELLKDVVEFENMSSPARIDIVNSEAVLQRVAESDAPFILHLAAKANPDECESDKAFDEQFTQGFIKENRLNVENIDVSRWQGSTSAFAINVVGTKNIVEAAVKKNKKMVHISTDYVFQGDTKDPYTEQSKRNAVNYYGRTKHWAEQVVEAIDPSSLILRIAIPFGSKSLKKPDIVSRFRGLFENNQIIQATDDQLVTPTVIDDIAAALTLLVQSNAQGIYHVVGNTTLSPYDFALAIAETFDYDKQLVKKASYSNFYKNRAPRPQYLTMSNEKIKKAGAMPKTISEALKVLRQTQ